MLMPSRSARTEPSPIATLHSPTWNEYNSPWFQPLIVTAAGSWSGAVTLSTGATPGVIGPCVPEQTMLLLSEAHAPRTPQFGVVMSAYFLPALQPSCRAPDSPSISVLLSPSLIAANAVRRF